MATERATLELAVETGGIDAADQKLNKLTKTGQRTQKAVDKAAISSSKMSQSLGGAGRSAGQAGIQIQQFVGQVQGGTNPLVAFSQQAADLGIVLGLPLAGAIVGIGSALAMAFIPSMGEAKTTTEDLVEAINDMYDSFDNMTPAVRRFLALDLAQKMTAQEQIIAKNRDRISEINEMWNDYGYISEEAADEQTKLNAEIDLATAQIQVYREQLSLVNGETKKQNEEVTRLVEKLRDEYETLGLSATQTLVYEAAKNGATAAELKQIESLSLLVEKKKEDIDVQNKQNTAADAYMEKLEKQASTLNLTKAQALSLESATLNLSQAERERVAQLIMQIDLEEKRVEKQKESDAAIRQLTAAGLLEDEAKLAESYNRRLQIIEDYRARDLISAEQHAEAKRKLEEDTQKAAIDQFGEGLNALAQYNKTAFKAAKAYNLASAIMNTYTGATKALATYPPPFNYIAAAGVIMSGMAQVQAIRSQQYQGRALGGQVRSGESYVVGERGPEVLTMGANGNITPNEKLRGGQGQPVSKVANISFNISTVDARGFDELLQSRRGQIINMVNRAMNDQGRRGVA